MLPAPARVGQDAGVLRMLTRLTGSGVVALLAYFLLPLDGDLGWLVALVVLLALLGLLVPLTVHRAGRVDRADAPVREAVEALVSLLVLLVVGFATVHYVVAARDPAAFGGLRTKVDGLYYSMAVVSTVGFGDITAEGQLARGVVTVQMFFDLLFLGVAVRVLGRSVEARAAGKP